MEKETPGKTRFTSEDYHLSELGRHRVESADKGSGDEQSAIEDQARRIIDGMKHLSEEEKVEKWYSFLGDVVPAKAPFRNSTETKARKKKSRNDG